jgi:hypothetical protein
MAFIFAGTRTYGVTSTDRLWVWDSPGLWVCRSGTARVCGFGTVRVYRSVSLGQSGSVGVQVCGFGYIIIGSERRPTMHVQVDVKAQRKWAYSHMGCI